MSVNAKEKVLFCKMNYVISGENDETDIEFKNLSIIDQVQTIYLDIEKRWLMQKVKVILRMVVSIQNQISNFRFKYILYFFSK